MAVILGLNVGFLHTHKDVFLGREKRIVRTVLKPGEMWW